MIRGEVSAHREAIVKLTIRGPAGHEADVEAAIDTGFTEYLTLPRTLIAALGLPFRNSQPVELGNGSVVTLSVYRGWVLWEGQRRMMAVHEAGGDALIGMSLLQGSRVTMDVVDGGPVIIEPLP